MILLMATSQAPLREQIIVHKGNRIFFHDWTGASYEEMEASIERMKKMILAEKSKVLMLADLTGVHFEAKLTPMLHAYLRHNAPYVGRFAAVGIASTYMTLVTMIRTLLRVPIPLFNTLDEAKAYLTRPPKKPRA